MKRETVFGILGVLLYTQPSVAQKSVTDTVRLNFNIDSVALEEVVVKGDAHQPLERYASGGTGHGGRCER